MRRLLKFALAGIAVVVLVALSHLYADQFIVVQYGEWRAEPPVVIAVVAVVVAVFALVFLFKLLAFVLFFPARISQWRAERAGQNRRKMLETGVYALALRDSRKSLDAFARLAKKEDPDGVFAFLAAQSAKNVGDGGGRAEWLRRAAAHGGADIAAAAKAELAAEEGREGEAFDILTEAAATDGSPLLAKMYLRTARRLGKWSQAMAAAYRLRDADSRGQEKDAAAEIAELALLSIDNSETLVALWKNNVAAAEQKNPRLICAFIHALHRLGDEKTLTENLERAVRAAPSSAEILAAAASFGGDKLCETAFAAAQKRGESGEKDPDFLRAMAMLAARLELWGRARRYYQMANSLHPDPKNAEALESLEIRMRGAKSAAEDSAETAR